MNDNNFSRKSYIKEIFNENFLKENEKILYNLQETKKNFRMSYMDAISTKYSSKGLYGDQFDMKNSISNFKLNESLKNKDSKKLSESKFF